MIFIFIFIFKFLFIFIFILTLIFIFIFIFVFIFIFISLFRVPSLPKLGSILHLFKYKLMVQILVVIVQKVKLYGFP